MYQKTVRTSVPASECSSPEGLPSSHPFYGILYAQVSPRVSFARLTPIVRCGYTRFRRRVFPASVSPRGIAHHCVTKSCPTSFLPGCKDVRKSPRPLTVHLFTSGTCSQKRCHTMFTFSPRTRPLRTRHSSNPWTSDASRKPEKELHLHTFFDEQGVNCPTH